jgi:hypothetical protein
LRPHCLSELAQSYRALPVFGLPKITGQSSGQEEFEKGYSFFV